MAATTALELNFCGGPEYQLLDARFAFPLLNSQIHSRRGQTCRGVSSASESAVGTFAWTAAVRAVAVLFLRIKTLRDEELDKPLLVGGRGSLAASLDAALAKPPQWLLDMFGVDAKGTSLLRRIIHRTNAELKRPGPVSIYLQSAQFSRHNIAVKVDGANVDDDIFIGKLLCQLEEAGAAGVASTSLNAQSRQDDALHNFSFGSEDCTEINIRQHNQKNGSSLSNNPRSGFFQRIETLAFDEARKSLGHTDIFSIRALCALNQRISVQSTRKNGGYTWAGTAEMDFGLSSAQLLGLVVSPDDFRRVFERIGKFTLCLTPSHIGAIAIFRYLQRAYGLQLDLRCAFPHTSAILSSIDGQASTIDADAVLLAHSQSQALLAQPNADFRPLMFMPATSYAVIAPQPLKSITKPKQICGDYLIFGGRESTSFMVFNDLLNSGGLDKKRVRYDSAELHEITQMIASGDNDSRAVLWYPYYGICNSSNGKLGNHSNCAASLDFREVVLFISKRLIADEQAVRTLNMAIRDAWIRLMSDPSLLASIVSNLYDLAGYEETIYRCSGAWRQNGSQKSASTAML